MSGAEREAILDAAERVLREGRRTSLAAVAAESGLSRDAVNAHFSGGNQILEAVVERVVRRGDDDTEWLVSCFVALVDMAHDEVLAGRIDAERALEELSATIGELLARRPSAEGR
jgi:AcrR family transcriptional regulator